MRRRRIPKIIITPREVNKTPGSKKRPIRVTPVSQRTPLPGYNFESFLSFEYPLEKSERLFIIAGGPSVSSFPLDCLKGEDVMCVNAAVKLIDNPKYFVTMDYSFLTKNVISIDEINNKVTDKSFFILKTNNPNLQIRNEVIYDKRHNFPYTHLKKFSHIIGSNLDLDNINGFGKTIDKFVNGNNSGFSAIQLGILLGYKEIYLIGFDLGFNNDQTHFHSWYGSNSNIKTKIDGYKNDLITSLKKLNQSPLPNKPHIFTLTESPLTQVIPKNDITKVIKERPKKVNMKNSYVVVSYYTLNTPYEFEAQKLQKSLKKLNVPYDVVGVKNLGNWQANTRFKAKFMQDMLIKHKGKSVVWVDSDAVIHSYPKLFDTYDCDVAVRWQDFRWRKNECLSGTIYLANNPMTLELCRRWEGQNIAEGPGAKTFEQWNLGKVIEEMRKEGKIKDENLPPEYTMIFDSMRQMYPNITPVIEHFQASRKLKNRL